MSKKRQYEAPKIVDLQVDYTQAVGQTRCLTGSTATGSCEAGAAATTTCNTGPTFQAQACQTGTRAVNCKTGSNAG